MLQGDFEKGRGEESGEKREKHNSGMKQMERGMYACGRMDGIKHHAVPWLIATTTKERVRPDRYKGTVHLAVHTKHCTSGSAQDNLRRRRV